MFNSLWPYRLSPIWLLCPWNFPGKNTGVGCHSLLQRIFLTLGLRHCRQTLYPLNHQGSPRVVYGSSTVCAVKSLQLCPTLCNSLDCSPPDSSVFGDSPARTLECVAMLSSRGSSEPRDQTLISCVPPRKQCNLCWTFAFLLRVWNFGNMLSRECWNDQSSVKNFDAKSKWASLGKNIVHVTALFWFLKLNYNGI